MHVRVDEPGNGDLAADVVFVLALVTADADDLAAGDGDIPPLHFAREYVEHPAVL